jgi:hypothetical protein
MSLNATPTIITTHIPRYVLQHATVMSTLLIISNICDMT